MTRKHIDDVQPATVKEHYDLIMKEKSEIDHEHRDITSEGLPDWYNEKLFKLGQRFMVGNLISMVISSLIGLVGILAIPSISKVLWHTKQSHTPYLAYKRYYQTIFYTLDLVIYDPHNSDKFYKTINTIRWKHVLNTNKARNNNIGAIYQRDMAITQFAFTGYAVLRPDAFGLRIKSEEEEAIIHFWRVIGYILGIPDRINICRKNVAETRELFGMLMDKCSEYLNNPSPEFNQLSEAMLDGIWYGNMTIDKKTLLTLTYRLNNVKHKISLGWYSWINLKYHELILWLFLVPYIGPILKTIYNKILFINFYFVQNLSLIAWMSFGRKKSQFN